MTDDDEIRRLSEIVAEHSGMLHTLNARLAPVYARIDAIRREIKMTHDVVRDHEAPREWRPRDNHHDGYQVRAYDPRGREQRFGLFAELDRLSETHGPTREKVRFHAAEMNGARRAIERIRERQKFTRT